jgi:hypothetical protein
LTEIEKRLDKLAEEINEEHRAFTAAVETALERGIRCGELLTEAKENCPHGTWLSWLETNFEGAPRTAQDYMRLYNHREEIQAKYAGSAHLSISSALKGIAGLERAHPFFEILEFIRETTTKAIAEAEESTSTSALEGIKSVEAMWTEHAAYDMAAGWLREFLIYMGNGARGELGQHYQTSLWFARHTLLEHVSAPDSRLQVEARMNGYQPVTIDLSDEERAVLRAIAPDTLAAVDAAWEEGKDYELAMRKMETFTRPADVPPSRERGGLQDTLTEEQMQTTFAELRTAGVFEYVPEEDEGGNFA